jgi:hypothetical protein
VTNTASCSASSCSWSATIPKSSGYAYSSGNNKQFLFTAVQDKVAGSTVDQGSTKSYATPQSVVFS